MYFSHQEWSDILRNIFVFIFAFYGTEFMVRGLKRFRKPDVITIKSEWYDIKKLPIPCKKDLINTELILCSENILHIKKYEDLNYNHQGTLVLFNDKLVTHWQYAPMPVKQPNRILKTHPNINQRN